MVDNSIEKINKHSSFGKGLENGELFFDNHIKIKNSALSGGIVKPDAIFMGREVDSHPNVGTPGHIDHGSVEAIQVIGKSTYGEYLSEVAPADIEYEMDEWKARPEPSSKFISDQRNSGKKRNKAKAKAQKKARKLTRRKK